MRSPYSKLIEDTYIELRRLRNVIDKILVRNGLDTKGLSFEELINELNNLNIIFKDKQYVGFKLDELGYVKEHFSVDYVEELDKVPEDMDYGYYTVVDGKLEIDEERKRLLEEVL